MSSKGRKLRDNTEHLLHKLTTFDLENLHMCAFISFLLDSLGCCAMNELLCMQYILCICSLFRKLSRAFMEDLEELQWLLHTMNLLLFQLAFLSWSSGESVFFYVLCSVTFKPSVSRLWKKIKKSARHRTFCSPNLSVHLLVIYYTANCAHLHPGILSSLLQLFI